jgi:TolB-like protein/Flp pilus assembly protein TadD
MIDSLGTGWTESMAETGTAGFWTELKRRKVGRVAVVYAVVAWAVVEIADVLFPALLLPEWSQRLVIALAVLGFPLALVLAWAFELTPGGLKREKSPAEEQRPSAAMPETTEPPKAPGGDKSAGASQASIAVLPMANLSDDPGNEYFSDGISEEILSLLARLPDLRVASRTSSFSLKNKQLDVRSIAEKLNVDVLLEGSVRRVGNQVRIAVQLVDAANDAHLWSEVYDRELEDIFALQTEIATRVVDAMDLGRKVTIRVPETPESIRAYDYYLRGRQLFYAHGESTLQAFEMFEKAIAIDPGFARAYAGIANTATFLAQWKDASKENLDRAEEASRKALELAPDLAEAHVSRAFALSQAGRYDEAAEYFERAIELDPQLYEAWYLYGRARFAQGRLEHAAELWARAHEVQPEEYQSVALRAMAITGLGKEREAQAAAEQAVELIQKALALNPGDLRALTLGAGAMINIGRVDEGLAWADKALDIAPNDIGVVHNAACAYAHAGRVDRALDLLEHRMTLGGTIYRDWLTHDTDFDSVRDHPRFKAILEALPGAPDRRT